MPHSFLIANSEALRDGLSQAQLCRVSKIDCCKTVQALPVNHDKRRLIDFGITITGLIYVHVILGLMLLSEMIYKK